MNYTFVTLFAAALCVTASAQAQGIMQTSLNFSQVFELVRSSPVSANGGLGSGLPGRMLSRLEYFK